LDKFVADIAVIYQVFLSAIITTKAAGFAEKNPQTFDLYNRAKLLDEF
jgi:hypothetical protein